MVAGVHKSAVPGSASSYRLLRLLPQPGVGAGVGHASDNKRPRTGSLRTSSNDTPAAVDGAAVKGHCQSAATADGAVPLQPHQRDPEDWPKAVEEWTPLNRGGSKSGLTFTLLRKVFSKK